MQKIQGTDTEHDINIRNLDHHVDQFHHVKESHGIIKKQLTHLFNAQNAVFDAEKALTHMRSEEGVASAVVTALTTPTTALCYRKGFKQHVVEPLAQMETLFAQIDQLIKDRSEYLLDYTHHKRKLEAQEERLAAAMQNGKKAEKVEELKEEVAQREARKDDAAYVLREASSHLTRKIELCIELLPLMEEFVSKGVAATYIAMSEASLSAFEWSLERFYHAEDDKEQRPTLQGVVGEGSTTPRPGGTEIRNMIKAASGKGSAPMPGFMVKLNDELNTDCHIDKPSHSKISLSGPMLKETVEAGAVFGRSLSGISEPPKLVIDCIGYLDTCGLYQKGLFRVPGNAETINNMKAALDAGEDVHFSPPIGVNDVGAIFKLYFRLLPEPLIPSAHFHDFLDATKDQANFAAKVKAIIDESFPPINRKILRLLLAFLSRVERLESTNMMSADNIGIVFAPNLLRPGPGEEDKVEYLQPGILATKLLVTDATCIFPDLWENYPQLGSPPSGGAVEEVKEDPAAAGPPPAPGSAPARQISTLSTGSSMTPGAAEYSSRASIESRYNYMPHMGQSMSALPLEGPGAAMQSQPSNMSSTAPHSAHHSKTPSRKPPPPPFQPARNPLASSTP